MANAYLLNFQLDKFFGRINVFRLSCCYLDDSIILLVLRLASGWLNEDQVDIELSGGKVCRDIGRLQELWRIRAKELQEAQYNTTTATTTRILPYNSVAFSDHNPWKLAV